MKLTNDSPGDVIYPGIVDPRHDDDRLLVLRPGESVTVAAPTDEAKQSAPSDRKRG